MKRFVCFGWLWVAGIGGLPAAAAPVLPSPVQSFFKEHCYECHDAETKKGELNLTALSPDFNAAGALPEWVKVYDRIESGEMPPKKKARPPQAAVTSTMKWLTDNLQTASLARQQKEGRVLLRRLNRVEYQNTLQDLLGVEVSVIELLPEDGVAHGFDRVDSALTLSPVQVEKYLEAADVALDAALGVGTAPRFLKEHYPGTNVLASWEAKGHRKLDDGAVVLFNSGYSPTELRKFRAPAPGRYRIRVSASGFQTAGQPMVFRLYAGNFGGGNKSHLIGHYEVAADKPTVIEINERLEDRGDTLKIVPYGSISWQNNGEEYKGPGLALQWIEVEGPLEAQTWPPPSRKQLLGDTAVERGTSADAARILRTFATRAFRRPVTDADMAPYLSLVQTRLAKGANFLEALRAGLKAVLVSPRFLLLEEQPGKLDSWALASRLSYFLWSTMPDAALLDAAGKGQLASAAQLNAQVERMLKDPKARGFTEDFTGQWLGLRNINFTTPDMRLYPEFDEMLEISMVDETHAFFNELLANDLSVLNFVHSDFAMLNERLAKHYGIPGVTGVTVHKVPLKPEWHRGGVLTQGSVLKVTANGTTTSPVLRGVWVSDRILGRPVPPPPPNVPAVEPDIRGAKSIRQQLAKHREVETCAGCHAKIDPVGFALENYDVIGGWRERYRISPERGQRAEHITLVVNQQDRQISIGPAVDAGDKLMDGRAFKNLDELKKLLLAEPDQIARGLTEKLLIYATGHELEFSDQRAVREIVSKSKSKNYGFRSLVHEVVQSPVFQSK